MTWRVGGTVVKSGSKPRLRIKKAWRGERVTLVVVVATPGRPTTTLRKDLGKVR